MYERKVGENSLKRDTEMTRAKQKVKEKVRGVLMKHGRNRILEAGKMKIHRTF